MELVIGALQFALYLYIGVLFARVIISWLMVLARDWRPAGVVLVLVELVYMLTDPPIKAIRKVVPPVQIGQIRLDVAFLIVVVGCWFLMAFLGSLA